jgi:hypothetical protein
MEKQIKITGNKENYLLEFTILLELIYEMYTGNRNIITTRKKSTFPPLKQQGGLEL